MLQESLDFVNIIFFYVFLIKTEIFQIHSRSKI